jgi:hypothetical protein
MYAGAFLLSRYASDNGQTKPIRVQPETLSLTIGGTPNAAPAPPITPGATFTRVSGGNRRYGTKARSITCRFTGAVPDGYLASAIIRLPILQRTLWSAVSVGDTGTYLGSSIVVVGKSAERVR